jgi:Aspartyl/Asparaginyl beta-hydroxylase
MINYPAVWRMSDDIDSSDLLKEFERVLSGGLSQVYPKNTDWTGISVFNGAQENYLENLPRLAVFLERFGLMNVLGVTYFNLAPNSVLHRHRDMNGNLLFGVMRLHIPLQTNPRAIMEVQRKSYHMPLNSLWALDTSGLHALENLGDQNRIHLVVDVKYSKQTAKYFPAFSLSLFLHLIGFVFIVVFKILRDMFTRPASIYARICSLIFRNAKK